MKLINKSLRPYGINGKIIVPGVEFELDDSQLPDVQLFIDCGDFEKLDSQQPEEKKKPGRPAKADKEVE